MGDPSYGIGNMGGEQDPYMGDEGTYQEHFRKTFITEK
jgi:hypothetical protein